MLLHCAENCCSAHTSHDSQALVVEQTNSFLKNSIQERHIGRLGLDSVRKERVSLVCQKLRDWYFFHCQNQTGIAQVRLKNGTHSLELSICKNAVGRWLDKDFVGGIYQCANCRRSERHSPLPFVFVLRTNPNRQLKCGRRNLRHAFSRSRTLTHSQPAGSSSTTHATNESASDMIHAMLIRTASENLCCFVWERSTRALHAR